MQKIAEDIDKLGEEIETAKRNLSQLEGRKEEVVKQIKTEFGITTVEELDTLKIKESQELETLKTSIREVYNNLKKEFQW